MGCSLGRHCPSGAGGAGWQRGWREGVWAFRGGCCVPGPITSGGERWPRASRASCLKLSAHLEARRDPAEGEGMGQKATSGWREAHSVLMSVAWGLGFMLLQ